MSYLRNWHPDFEVKQSGIAVVIQLVLILSLAGFLLFKNIFPVQQWGIYLSLIAIFACSCLRLNPRFRLAPLYVRACDGVWLLNGERDCDWSNVSVYSLHAYQVWPFLVVVKLRPIQGSLLEKQVGTRSLLIFPDSTDRDNFRRLKIYLRFGRGDSGQ